VDIWSELFGGYSPSVLDGYLFLTFFMSDAVVILLFLTSDSIISIIHSSSSTKS